MKVVNFIAAMSILALLVIDSSPAAAVEALVTEDDQTKVPAELVGNWACEVSHSDDKASLHSAHQMLISSDGHMHVVGQMRLSANIGEFSVSNSVRGEIQLVDGKYWERVDRIISLPTVSNVDGLTATYLKSSIDKEFPTYETGTYEVDSEYLIMLSDRAGIETTCITWGEWESLCEEQNNSECGVLMDKQRFEQTHQTFLENQSKLKELLEK